MRHDSAAHGESAEGDEGSRFFVSLWRVRCCVLGQRQEQEGGRSPRFVWVYSCSWSCTVLPGLGLQCTVQMLGHHGRITISHHVLASGWGSQKVYRK